MRVIQREKESRRRKPPKGAHSKSTTTTTTKRTRPDDCATHSRNRIFPSGKARRRDSNYSPAVASTVVVVIIILYSLLDTPTHTHTHTDTQWHLLMYLFVFSRVFVTLRTQAMSAPKNRMWCPLWSNSSHSPSMRIIAIHKCNCRHNPMLESLWPLLPKKKIYNLTPASCKCFVTSDPHFILIMQQSLPALSTGTNRINMSTKHHPCPLPTYCHPCRWIVQWPRPVI